MAKFDPLPINIVVICLKFDTVQYFFMLITVKLYALVVVFFQCILGNKNHI